jgi:hypothetical protein
LEGTMTRHALEAHLGATVAEVDEDDGDERVDS